ncbi:DUF1127 domain-containing protein [Amaricoccus macauensis]|uniref:DUF1127 domain-containing protein n=1 Tax=Amaricoccus macauensis TaxID=57001 RepID=UPI003C7DC410
MAFASAMDFPFDSNNARRMKTRFRAAVRNWKTRRRTAAELNALSDRDLADIGIARFEIASVVREL